MNRRIKNDVGSNTKVRDFRYGFATFLTEKIESCLGDKANGERKGVVVVVTDEW